MPPRGDGAPDIAVRRGTGKATKPVRYRCVGKTAGTRSKLLLRYVEADRDAGRYRVLAGFDRRQFCRRAHPPHGHWKHRLKICTLCDPGDAPESDTRGVRIKVRLAARVGNCGLAGLVERFFAVGNQKRYVAGIGRTGFDETVENIAHLRYLMDGHVDLVGDAVAREFRRVVRGRRRVNRLD